MLVGRDHERARIRRLIAGAVRGRSGVVVVRGDAGVGKTALLDDAVRRLRGTTVLRATGIESESELPYAGLATLLGPVVDLADELPAVQADALRAALALRLGVADPLAACAATLGVLSVAAEEQAVVCLVDDAHWLDRESAQAIGFAARRIADERIAIVIAVRDLEASTFSTEGFEELLLGGLGAAEAVEVLDGRVAAPVARRLAAATAGNPLVLLELAATLSDGQRAGIDPLDDPVDVAVSAERLFGRQLRALPDLARAAVLVCAAAGERNELEPLLRACASIGCSDGDLADAERAGLLGVAHGRVAFRHPLVRAAAYALASSPDRRAAHTALAVALDADELADERAWHLALAATGTDEAAAQAIEAVGRRMRDGSRHTAMRALIRAAELTPPGPRRTSRALAAAHAATAAGAWSTAGTLLAQAADATGDEDVERRYLLGIVACKEGQSVAGATILEDVADALAGRNPDRAALAEVQAAEAWMEVDETERALAAAERGRGLAVRPGGDAELAVLLSLGDTAGWAGRLEEAVEYWRRAGAVVDQGDHEGLRRAGEALFSAGDDDAALRLLQRAEWLARERSALGSLTIVLELQALSWTRAGQLDAAYAAVTECVALIRSIGQRAELPKALGIAAWIEAILGRELECRRHTAEAHDALRGLGYAEPFGRPGEGLLELSLGHTAGAVDALEGALQVRIKRLDAEVIASRPILPLIVEALARAGRHTDASAVLGNRVGVARRTGRAHAIAPLLRAHGVLHTDEDSLREALGWHERWTNRWEQARTELCLGELLRRSKRRAEARTALRSALAGFEETGAVVWAGRARRELRATGERARRRQVSTVDELTPQELQVARLVATGLTNRDVAARLFLSPKTIETHLGHVFRKTGVRTRAELAHRFRDLPDSIASPAS